jgi:thiamine biosynthesis protein ThiS
MSRVADTISITVNAQARDVARGTTVRQLIVAMGLGGSAVAAEVSGRLVARRDHETRELIEGERVELVTLVGGG